MEELVKQKSDYGSIIVPAICTSFRSFVMKHHNFVVNGHVVPPHDRRIDPAGFD